LALTNHDCRHVSEHQAIIQAARRSRARFCGSAFRQCHSDPFLWQQFKLPLRSAPEFQAPSGERSPCCLLLQTIKLLHPGSSGFSYRFRKWGCPRDASMCRCLVTPRTKLSHPHHPDTPTEQRRAANIEHHVGLRQTTPVEALKGSSTEDQREQLPKPQRIAAAQIRLASLRHSKNIPSASTSTEPWRPSRASLPLKVWTKAAVVNSTVRTRKEPCESQMTRTIL